ARLQRLSCPVRRVRPRDGELRRHRALPDDRRAGPADRRARDIARRRRRPRRGERHRHGAGTGGESRLHELHGAPAVAVRAGRPRHHRRRAARAAAGGLRDRRPRSAVPERRRQHVRRSGPRDRRVARVRVPEDGAMTSYRFRRRAFLTALSGGVGLKVMLRTLEGSAQGMRSPGRLLVTHWPVGIVAGSNRVLWNPMSGSVGGSQALKPFADAGLGPDMTVLGGLTTNQINLNGSGGHEGGTVALVTGVAPGGTRAGEAEGEYAFSAGPSLEQILLRSVPGLQAPGPGYANSIADSRTDFGEIAPKCLSYSPEMQPVNAIRGASMEARPLTPEISPIMQYTNLFSGFVPGSGAGGSGGGAGGSGGQAGSGGASPRVADAMLKRL